MMKKYNNRTKERCTPSAQSEQPTEDNTPSINIPASMYTDCSVLERELYALLCVNMHKNLDDIEIRVGQTLITLHQYQYALIGGVKGLRFEQSASTHETSNMLRNLTNKGYIATNDVPIKCNTGNNGSVKVVTVLRQPKMNIRSKKAIRQDIIDAFNYQNTYINMEDECHYRFNCGLAALLDEHEKTLKEHQQKMAEIEAQQREDRKHLYEVEGYCKYLEEELSNVCSEMDVKYGSLSERINVLERGGNV